MYLDIELNLVPFLSFFVFPPHIPEGITKVTVTESISKKITCCPIFGPAVYVSDAFHIQETPFGHIPTLMSPKTTL